MTEPVELPETGPGSKHRRTLFFAVCGAGLLALLVAFRGVLLPFLLAIVVAYVLAPLVRRMERFMPRWVSVVVLYGLLLGTLGALSVVAVPRVVAESEKLAQEAPKALSRARKQWIPWITGRLETAMQDYEEKGVPATSPTLKVEPDGLDTGAEELDLSRDGVRVIPDGAGGFFVALPSDGISVVTRGDGVYRVLSTRERQKDATLIEDVREAISGLMDNTQSHAVAIFRTAQSFIRAVVKGLFAFVITLMLSAYLLATSGSIFSFFRTLVRRGRREQFDRLLSMIDRGLSGVVRGQLIIALLNGLLSGIAFFLLDLRYWPILTLIATVLSIVPIFGAILSSVPAVIVALEQGFVTAGITLAVIVGIHQLEANLFNPKIMGDAAKVHPVLVVFALLAGEHLFGIAGALLAVPVLSITQSLFLYYREQALDVSAPRMSPPDIEARA